MIQVPRSCASCDETDCDMHKLLPSVAAVADRVAWILDDVWPETASMIAASFRNGDQLIAPSILGAWPKRYDWPIERRRVATVAMATRHWAMRRVARASGAIRQATYLKYDRLVARRLARAIDFRARHLVVAQAWLPWLDELGVFGGRTFDVVMSRYPLGEIHRLLDAAGSEVVSSATIGDFRAEAELVEREHELLARARRLYTPHHGIAALFPDRAALLAWHVPPAIPVIGGTRVAFLGPTIARQRPDIARRLAGSLRQPLVVFGRTFEPLWDGVAIEAREGGLHWLDGIGAILHPATLTHEPRQLLEARANGIAIYATETCGLSPSDYLPLDQFQSG